MKIVLIFCIFFVTSINMVPNPRSYWWYYNNIKYKKINYNDPNTAFVIDHTPDDVYYPVSFALILNNQYFFTRYSGMEYENNTGFRIFCGKENFLPIEKIIVHPQYDAKQYLFNAAIIKTTEPMKFTKDCQPIHHLPIQGESIRVPELDEMYWEYNATSVSAAPTHSEVVRYAECLRHVSGFYNLHESMFCILISGVIDDCQDEFRIYSYKVGTKVIAAYRNFPGVCKGFTNHSIIIANRFSYYVNWINDNISFDGDSVPLY